MFGFLKKLLIKFIDNLVDSVKITDTDWEKYRQEVFYLAKNKRDILSQIAWQKSGDLL